MPTILQSGPYRVFFYSGDGREPPHVHIERDQAIAKFWLSPVRLAKSGGFPGSRAGDDRGVGGGERSIVSGGLE